MEEHVYYYESEDGETLEFKTNIPTEPPKEMIFNCKKFYLG